MTLLEWGAFAFGAVIGWNTYFVNRHRDVVKIADLLSIIGALGGAAVLSLFPEQTVMFALYGIGLAAGFFGYFLLLVIFILINRSKGWSMAYFLDGRRPALGTDEKTDGSFPMVSGDSGSQGL
ncbi:hypothetical protein [Actinoplanes friuliensis]|uniref:Uncharacterized protein n=1 Tax=Actinoplanes friuliensis DSM 7358 TaxID=1246995 RepID=U5W4S8_9ACTN|nr:hypothetical protein [Actinoplanes friuliensis]AGZ42941.1 hypothetical protein AFR_23355 [Actinoplanes friuliensis DSM 7358]